MLFSGFGLGVWGNREDKSGALGKAGANCVVCFGKKALRPSVLKRIKISGLSESVAIKPKHNNAMMGFSSNLSTRYFLMDTNKQYRGVDYPSPLPFIYIYRVFG